MAQLQAVVHPKRWRRVTSQTLAIVGDALVIVAFAPHFRVFRRGTYLPIRRILESTTETELRDELQRWLKYKEHESGYVQVAGAVIFASVTSCLQWNSLSNSHWSGPALWYGSIIFAIAAIFTGAQQSLVLPEAKTIDDLASEELEKMKMTFASGKRGSIRPSMYALVAWQMPIMLLGYAVVTFLAGLCSVVLSPFARDPRWNEEAKTAILFIAISVFSLICWLFPSSFVHRLRSPES